MTRMCTTAQRPRLGRGGSSGCLPGRLPQNDLILTHVAPSWAKLNPGGRGSTTLTVRMFMSDDNYRKPSSPRATRVGLGLSGTEASFDRRPNETLAGRATSGRNYGGLADSEDRYMDPPSETHGVERDEVVRQLSDDTDARARVATPSHTPGQGLFGSTLRAHTTGHPRIDLDAEARHYTRQQDDDRDQRDEHESEPAGGAGLFQGALDNTVRAQPVAAQAAATTRPPPAPVAGRVAPEAWRDEVRRMVERAPSKGPGPSAPSLPSAPSAPSSQLPGGLGGPSAPGGAGGPGIPGSFKPSLRLKLDADAAEEVVYRAPKSALPKVLIWLVILGLVGGGLVLFADPKGIAGLLKRFSAPEPTLTTQDPQPPAAAAPSAPTVDPSAAQQPPAAAPSTPATPTQPAAAATAPAASTAPAQPSAAAQPAAQPTTTPPAVAQPKAEAPKAAEPAAKPAAPVAKPAAPKPARPVRPQQPVVKVRPIESAPSSPETSAPPTPDHPDIPYVPMPGDPPAPDEPR